MIFYDGPISLLPVAHTIIQTIYIGGEDMTHFRFIQGFSLTFMIAYNILVEAYAGVVLVVVQFISSVVSIVRLDSGKIKKALHK